MKITPINANIFFSGDFFSNITKEVLRWLKSVIVFNSPLKEEKKPISWPVAS